MDLRKELNTSKYLKAMDADPNDLRFTIRAFSKEVFEDDKGNEEKKLVVWFNETEKGLVLNQINGDTIMSIHGTHDTDKLIGKEVVLYKTRTQFGPKMVDCIRIRGGNGEVPF